MTLPTYNPLTHKAVPLEPAPESLKAIELRKYLLGSNAEIYRVAIAAAPEVPGDGLIPVEYLVGNYYYTKSGNLVKVTQQKQHCILCSDGKHRYNRPGDYGRVTGTAHDYSYPENFVQLFALPAPPTEKG